MSPRRQFALPSFDEQYLATTGLVWETIVDRGTQWLLLLDRPNPAGYTVAKTTTALMIPSGYPDNQIDMAYFCPELVRADGHGIPALTGHALDGRCFQRWSRHRTAEGPWRPGLDDVSSHLALVDDWLARELRRK